jgi:hypothetical protein
MIDYGKMWEATGTLYNQVGKETCQKMARTYRSLMVQHHMPEGFLAELVVKNFTGRGLIPWGTHEKLLEYEDPELRAAIFTAAQLNVPKEIGPDSWYWKVGGKPPVNSENRN